MKPFMFVIVAVPSKENRHYRNIFKAKVHIWVMDNNIDNAKQKALNDITAAHWIPQNVEHEFEMTDVQLDDLHEAEAVLYQKALAYGIASDYIASPIHEKPKDSPVVIDDVY